MPRYYRRRYTRVLKPKKKWASNIKNIGKMVSTTAIPKIGLGVQLCVNQNQVSIPTPTILKAGNFKVQADVIVQTSSQILVNIIGYVIYIPEGVLNLTNTNFQADFDSISAIVDRHPEWIMAWKQFGFDGYGSDNNVDRVSFSSRLKRNLNSGDSIYFVLLANNLAGSGGMTGLNVNGMCQFWTCAN